MLEFTPPGTILYFVTLEWTLDPPVRELVSQRGPFGAKVQQAAVQQAAVQQTAVQPSERKLQFFFAKKMPGSLTVHFCELLTVDSSGLKRSKKGNMLDTSTQMVGGFLWCIWGEGGWSPEVITLIKGLFQIMACPMIQNKN